MDVFIATAGGTSPLSDLKEARSGTSKGDARGFFNTGVSQYLPPNHGLYEYTMRSEDIGKFRPPTLRNMAITAPYMHEGSLSTLEEVIDYYAAGGPSSITTTKRASFGASL